MESSHIFCPQPFHCISHKQDVLVFPFISPLFLLLVLLASTAPPKGPYSFPHVCKCLLFTHLPRSQHNTSQRHAKYKIRRKDAGIFLKPGAKRSGLLKKHYVLYMAALLLNTSNMGVYLIFHNTQYKVRCDFASSHRLCSEENFCF